MYATLRLGACVAPIRAEKLGLDRDNLLDEFIALARVA
eukprot:COSAG06_NODE_15884_length_1037_cov_2.299574_2_plen_38_part_00